MNTLALTMFKLSEGSSASVMGLIELLMVVVIIACFVGGYRMGPGLGYYGGGGVGMLLLIILALLLLGII